MLHGFHFAFKMIQKRPLRMGLTILQVAVGVAAVTMILSFIYAVLYSGNSADHELLYLAEYGGKEIESGTVVGQWTESMFTAKMVEKIREKSTEIEGMSIIDEQWGGTVECEGIRYSSQGMTGTDADFAQMMNIKMLEGTFFTRADLEGKKRVAIISNEANKQLFGNESGVGKTFLREHYDNTQYEWKIIGVFATENISQGSYNRPLHLIVPYTSMYAEGIENVYSRLLIQLKPGRVTEGQTELNMLLNQELENAGIHPEHPGELFFNKAYSMENDGREQIAKIFGLFFGSFAFVALVVSSIGILSMMLVSIVERTREIGLRRALGASRLSIVGQILVESVVISLMGGGVGIILAAFFVKPFVQELLIKAIFTDFMGIQASLSLYPVLIAMACVIVVGLLAGLYPGIRASRVAPVVAIREE